MFDRRLLSRMNSPKSIAANVHDTNHFFAQRNAYLQWNGMKIAIGWTMKNRNAVAP